MGDGERKKNKNRNSGHFAGVQTVKKIVEASIKSKFQQSHFCFLNRKLEKTKNRDKFFIQFS